jgi:two-component system sensor histidine kinase KdpD
MKVEDVEAAIRGIAPTQGVKSVEIFLARGKAYLRPSTGEVEFDQLKPLFGETQDAEGARSTVIVELEGARGPLGIVKFRLSETERDRTKLPDLQSIAALLALATERCLLLDEVTQAQAQAQSEALKDALLSSVSHDLRTPLTVIQAAAGALNSNEVQLPEAERQKLIVAILDQCRRLDRYTAELLDVGKIQSGIPMSQLETVDLKETIQLAIKQAGSAHPSIQVERHLSQSPVHVRANAVMLEQAIYNLIDNAYKFGRGCGPVRVQLDCNGAMAIVTVADNGPGIKEHDQARIFTRFFRGQSAPGQAGMGLGLFIAKGFVEAFSGSIEIDSPVEDGKGTRFSILLPFVDAHELAEPVT